MKKSALRNLRLTTTKPSRRDFVEYLVWQPNTAVDEVEFAGYKVQCLFEAKEGDLGGVLWPQAIFFNEEIIDYLTNRLRRFPKVDITSYNGYNNHYQSFVPELEKFDKTIQVREVTIAKCKTTMIVHYIETSIDNETVIPILFKLTPELSKLVDWQKWREK